MDPLERVEIHAERVTARPRQRLLRILRGKAPLVSISIGSLYNLNDILAYVDDEPNRKRLSKRKVVESEDGNSADEGTSSKLVMYFFVLGVSYFSGEPLPISRSPSPEPKSPKLTQLNKHISVKGKAKLAANEMEEGATELEEALKSDADEAEGEDEVEMDVDADELEIAHAAVSKT